ncbi:hypothetical protein FHR47_002945 [Xanthomonas arboricola]|uniref:hypothetical protein n=1 Tax=Xanthomonas cannabis TaxID=1885674 RepID=UPI0017B5B644|nr:hypothetical protein [Xanthomonas cannabis]MBB3802666.1 hypothetical protein [Xanthomonas cannabis]
MRLALLLLRVFLLQALANAFVELLGRIDAIQFVGIQPVGFAKNLLHQRVGFGHFLRIAHRAMAIVNRPQRLVPGLDQRAGDIAHQLRQELPFGLAQLDGDRRAIELFDQGNVGLAAEVEQGLQFAVIALAPLGERHLPGLQLGPVALQVVQQPVEAFARRR